MVQLVQCPMCSGQAIHFGIGLRCDNCGYDSTVEDELETPAPPPIVSRQSEAPSVVRTRRRAPRPRGNSLNRMPKLAAIVATSVVVMLLLAIAMGLGAYRLGFGILSRQDDLAGFGFRPSRELRAAVLAKIEANERSYQILEWFSPESVVGAWIRDSAVWFPLGHRGEGILTTEQLRACAIRVKYNTDEGFGRYDRHDDVFIVYDGRVIKVVDAVDFRIGKPGG